MTTTYLFSPPGEEPEDTLPYDPIARLTKDVLLLSDEVSRGAVRLDSVVSELAWTKGRLIVAFNAIATLTRRIEILETIKQ